VIFQDSLFWVIAVVAVGASLLVIHLQDVFRAALFLVVSFLSIAVLFVLLNAEFLAVVQVLIYAGAIAILIIFAIMLTRDVQRGNRPSGFQPLALVAGSLLLAALVFAIIKTEWRLLSNLSEPTVEATEKVFSDTPGFLADLLLRQFVLPFEVASVLLLAAIIGALVLVREQ